MNKYLYGLLNGCSTLTEFQAAQGANYTTDAVTGCVQQTGGTVHQVNGVAGYAVTNQNSSSGGGAVGGYFQGRVLSGPTNAAAWGINPLVQDTAGVTGHQIAGEEVDVNFFGSPARVWGIIISGASTGTAPTGNGNAGAIEVRAPGYAGNGVKWVTGVNIETGATSGAAIAINPQAAGATQNSQTLQFNATNGASGTMTANLALDVNGLMNIPCGNANVTYGSGFNAGSITTGHTGFCAFAVAIGVGTAGSTGVINLPASASGWVCNAQNFTRAAQIQMTGSSVSSVTLTNFGTTWVATNWTNSDTILVQCMAR